MWRNQLWEQLLENGRHTRPLIISLDLGLHARSHPVGSKWSQELWAKIPEPHGGPSEWPAESWDQSNKGYISNTLRRQGLKSCSARRVPLLKPVHVQARLKFAREHLDDPEEDWENVIWSDETKIELFGKNSTCCVWRRKNAELHSKNTIPTVKHGGGKTSCFGAVFLQRDQDDWSV